MLTLLSLLTCAFSVFIAFSVYLCLLMFTCVFIAYIVYSCLLMFTYAGNFMYSSVALVENVVYGLGGR